MKRKPLKIPLAFDGSFSDTLLAYGNAMRVVEDYLEDASLNKNKPYTIEELMFPTPEYRDELNSIHMSDSNIKKLRKE
jgi:hypothetical protein